MNGIMAPALIGLRVFILGMIIIWLTPEERPKR